MVYWSHLLSRKTKHFIRCKCFVSFKLEWYSHCVKKAQNCSLMKWWKIIMTQLDFLQQKIHFMANFIFLHKVEIIWTLHSMLIFFYLMCCKIKKTMTILFVTLWIRINHLAYISRVSKSKNLKKYLVLESIWNDNFYSYGLI